MGAGGVQFLLAQPQRCSTVQITAHCLLGVHFHLLSWSEDIPPSFSPHPRRKDRAQRPPLSHFLNSTSHTNSPQFQTSRPSPQQAVLQHFLLGCIFGSLCPFWALVCITVTSQWSCFICASRSLFQKTKQAAVVCCLPSPTLHPTLSNAHLGPFLPHNTINLPLHKREALSYADNSCLGTLLVLTLHCQAQRGCSWVDKHKGHVSNHFAAIHPDWYGPNAESTLYFQNKMYSTALINIQQSVHASVQ